MTDGLVKAGARQGRSSRGRGDYALEEVLHNLPLLPAAATSAWRHLRIAPRVRGDRP